MVDLVALRLLEAPRPRLPVAAGVHHQGVIEPQAIEVGPEPVVRARVRLGLVERTVRVAPLVHCVLRPIRQPVLQVESAGHGGREGGTEIAFDIDVLIEVGLQQADVTPRQRSGQCRFAAKPNRERGRAGADLQRLTLGEYEVEGKTRWHVERIDELARQEMGGACRRVGKRTEPRRCDTRQLQVSRKSHEGCSP